MITIDVERFHSNINELKFAGQQTVKKSVWIFAQCKTARCDRAGTRPILFFNDHIEEAFGAEGTQ